MAELCTLDGNPLPFAPNSVNWGYKLNLSSTDTLGGRVIQLLSVKISTISWQADAGSAENLLALYDTVYQIMLKHVSTERPVQLVVPSKGWNLAVYVTSMPGMGWDIKEVTFKYSLNLEVDQDFGGVASSMIMAQELARLGEGVGYDPAWQGAGVANPDTGAPYEGADPTRPGVAIPGTDAATGGTLPDLTGSG